MSFRPLAALTVSVLLAISSAAEAGVVTTWNAYTATCVLLSGAAGRPGPPGLLDIALVQAAVHDAVQAVEGRYQPYRYSNSQRLGEGTTSAAAASAAYWTLVGIYGVGGQEPACLAAVPKPWQTYPGDPGLITGQEAAAVLVPLERPTFAVPPVPFLGGTAPGEWRVTPGSTEGTNRFMAHTEPFALLSPRQFRPQPPPPLTSEQYRRDYDEVKAVGAMTNSTRTPEETDLARFWGAPSNPLVMWFTTVRAIADEHVGDVGEQARLLALVAMAAADAQITIYDSKYFFNFWRPVTAIQEGDEDGNPRTDGDAGWLPQTVTPPYPDYTSGANCLAGSITTMLRLYLGTDDVDFTISSPVANLMQNPRSYTSFSQAQQEIVDVRVLQGIHFRFADEEGRRQGARVAHWVYSKFLKPVPGSR
jgi:hypothetical protein